MALDGDAMDEATITYATDGERVLPWAFLDLAGTMFLAPLPPAGPTTNPLGDGSNPAGVAFPSSRIRRQAMRFAAFPDALYSGARQAEDRPGELAVAFFGGV